MNSDRIYLDHSATTPLRPEVSDAMREAAEASNYNPSSLHAEGLRARALLDGARERVAALLGAARSEIAFTSGGTESDNLALLGVARAARPGTRIVATAIEHRAVISALERLREEGFQTTALPVTREGRLDPDEFAKALDSTTVLASVMYANNEIGTVQPIRQLAAVARKRDVLFHTDAVQAPNWLPLDVRELGVDMLSLSAHKFGGPRGVGLLYVRRNVPLAAILYGGGQEFGRRPGTQNVAGVVGLARALELAIAERGEATRRIALLRDRLESGIRAAISDVCVNGTGHRLPNNLHASFAGVESDSLLIALDLAGIAVSGGSACASGSLEPSHVLAALGSDPRFGNGGVRFSLGISTTAADIDRVLTVLPSLVGALRRPAGVGPGGWVD